MLVALLFALALQPVRVYLYTEIPPFTDAATQARLDTVQDLRAALKGKGRVRLVETKADAQVIIEVLDRGSVHSGYLRQGPTWRETRAHVVAVKLSVGDYATILTGSTRTAFKRRAAGDCAGEIEKWIKANTSRLPQ